MAMKPITDLVLRAISRLGRAHLAKSNKETLGRPVLGLAMSYDVDPILGKVPNLAKSNFIIRASCIEVDD